MLRRTKTIVLRDDPDTRDTFLADVEDEATPASDRRRLDRRQDDLRPDAERTVVPILERREGERRNQDDLRTEFQRSLARAEEANPVIPRPGVSWTFGAGRASRIVVLLVALLAGGAAAYLALHRDEPAVATAPVEVAEPVAAPTTQILVAKDAIATGQRLAAATLEWQAWPESALRPEYITIAAAPDALTGMDASVARATFYPGEPIRQEKLAPAGQGFLSAILDSGKRGVSVSVEAESASGGFIVPNDHVDVVLTRTPGDGPSVSETILTNVRILAINGQTSAAAGDDSSGSVDPATEVFADKAIATLELDTSQSEVIINATTMGHLSLVLRATADLADTTSPGTANQSIRISSPFWAK